MKVRVVSDIDEALDLAPAWQHLADAAGGRATSQPWWALAWWRHLGSGTLRVVTVWDGAELLAVAPLHERRIGGLRVVRFLGHGLGAVSEILLDPHRGHEAVGAVWSTLLDGGPRLVQCLEYREPAGGVDALRRTGRWSDVAPSDSCPVARPTGAVEEFLARRPKRLRRTLRQAEGRLAAGGHHHDVEVVRQRQRLDEVLGEVEAVYDASERARPRQHLLAPPWEHFAREVLAVSAAEGRLWLVLGRVDGRPASFDVAFATGDRIELWIGRYHPSHGQYSPGHLAMRATVEHAGRAAVAEIDMGLGDDRYKRLWCDDAYRTLRVTAASSRAALAAGQQLLAARRWARHQVDRRVRGREAE